MGGAVKSGKIWGQTSLIYANHVLELHRIEVKAGGFCSKHKHLHKWNGFFVEKGTLKISVFKNDYALVDETILKAGDFMAVKPSEFHMFKAEEDTVAMEIYWAEPLDAEDIERETVGGNAP